MTDDRQADFTLSSSPGVLLKAEREAQGMPEREAADRLNWMPGYVAVIESDNYEKLRNPAFARGYVKAYTRLLGLDEKTLIIAFDRNQEQNAAQIDSNKKISKPLQLQKTGLGVVIGLGALLALILFMWWRGG